MKPRVGGNSSSGNSDADPGSFTVVLKKSVKKTAAIVLVAPYALASKNDCGSAISAIAIIKDIVLAA